MVKDIIWEGLTNEVATRYFLFGQLNKPTSNELVDDKWIDRTNDFSVNITNMDSYMIDGPGRFSNASEIPLIVDFFDLNDSGKIIPEGKYSLNDIKKILGFDNDDTHIQHTIKQSRYLGLGDFDYINRVYVFETQKYSINEDSIFIIKNSSANGIAYDLSIKDFSLIPGNEDFNLSTVY